jgi:hypothetical protein
MTQVFRFIKSISISDGLFLGSTKKKIIKREGSIRKRKLFQRLMLSTAGQYSSYLYNVINIVDLLNFLFGPMGW